MPELQLNRINGSTFTTSDSWRVLRAVSEMVNAMDELNALQAPCISIFGSARSKPESKEYKAAVNLARLLVEAGYGIITGGGPGVMEAANKGASEAGGASVGLHIKLPQEQACNKYVTTRCSFRYFFIRKFMFVKYAQAYVVMPGGMGTIDELSEAFVLGQTGRNKPFPIVLYDSGFWSGLLDWLRQTMAAQGFIREDEMSRLLHICDTPEEVVSYLMKMVIV